MAFDYGWTQIDTDKGDGVSRRGAALLLAVVVSQMPFLAVLGALAVEALAVICVNLCLSVVPMPLS